jgi:hypothetical protein
MQLKDFYKKDLLLTVTKKEGQEQRFLLWGDYSIKKYTSYIGIECDEFSEICIEEDGVTAWDGSSSYPGTIEFLN